MKKHYVTFLSPGTFVHETNTEEIDSWNVEAACKRALEIVQRHNSKPFGFYFTTRERGEEDFEPKETAQSGMYFLGGTVRTYDEVVADNKPDEEILRSNMKWNNIDRIVTNTNSWKMTQPLKDQDVVLDFDMEHGLKSSPETVEML